MNFYALSGNRPLLILFFLALESPAAEVGRIHSLQKGPIGDGYDLSQQGWVQEIAVNSANALGWERTNDTYLKSQENERRLRLGGNYYPSPNFLFHFGFEARSAHVEGSTSGLQNFSEKRGHEIHEIGGGPAFFGGGILFASRVKLHFAAAETREYTRSGVATTYHREGASWPTIEGTLGLHNERFLFALTFNPQSGARVAADSQSGTQTRSYQTEYNTPAKVSIDYKYQVATHLAFGAHFAYVATGNASDDIGEYAIATSSVNPVAGDSSRSGVRRNKNHVEMGFGAAYMPVDFLRFVGALDYTEPFYTEDDFASVFEDNLGGTKAMIGIQRTFGEITLSGNLDYTIPTTHRFTYRDQFHQNWMDPQTVVQAELGGWDVGLGIMISL